MAGISKKERELEERLEKVERMLGITSPSEKEKSHSVPKSFVHNDKEYAFNVAKFTLKKKLYITEAIADKPEENEEILGLLEEMEAAVVSITPSKAE